MTHYMYNSTKEHQGIDYRGIHKKICSLLIHLRAPAPFLNSGEDRQNRKDEMLLRQVGRVMVVNLQVAQSAPLEYSHLSQQTHLDLDSGRGQYR